MTAATIKYFEKTSTFAISFRWGCDHFDAMKSSINAMPGRQFDGDTKAWLVPGRPENGNLLASFVSQFSPSMDDAARQALDAIKDAPPPPRVTIKREGDSIIIAWPKGHPQFGKLLNFVKLIPNYRFDSDTKSWSVPNVADAARRVLDLASQYESVIDQGTIDELRGTVEQAERSLKMSRAVSADANVPCPAGLAYLPYQIAGIAYGCERQNVLIGDEMGLGKTIQAIGIANADESSRSVLIICPASLKINWQREWRKWDTKGLSVEIADTRGLPDAEVVIVNYDIAWRLRDELRTRPWDVLIMDEAHYLKNPQAQRTHAVFGAEVDEAVIEPIKARRRIALTGTPIPNRPAEGWTLFHALAPQVFSSWYHYVTRYADAYRTPFGMEVSGASHLSELQEKLRSTMMIRRLKADVLSELPAKRRQIIEFPADEADPAIAAEQHALRKQEDRLAKLEAAAALAMASEDGNAYHAAVRALREGRRAAFTEMAKMRHETALAKVPAVVSHLKDAMEGNRDKLIVFAHHKDVIDAMADAMQEVGVVQVTGDTPMAARQDAVDAFQNDPEVRLFIGNIQAAGVGLTLTASPHVVFAELDWVPGNMTQAEDRAHRIGQKNAVLVQHLVLDGSLDARLARTLIEKQAVLDQALDEVTPEQRAELPKVTALEIEDSDGEPALEASLDDEARASLM